MADSDQEKIHPPSQEKLRKARNKGEVAVSREIVVVISFVGALIYMFLAHRGMQSKMEECMRDYLTFNRLLDINMATIGPEILRGAGYIIQIAGPLMLVVLVMAILATTAQTNGLVLATEKSYFDINRLNPVNGLKKLFSADKLWEGLKSAIKALVFGLLCYLTIKGKMKEIVMLSSMPVGHAFQTSIWIGLTLIYRVALLMILFAIIDFAFQKYQFTKKMRMTTQEIRDEHKQLEGDPKNKQRQRSKQMEISRNRMMASVKQADVVVTNPTHYAVALKYDSDLGGAPRLTAKGARLLAQRIKDEAKKNNVPIVEDKYVARTIFFGTKIGQEIPYNLYRAVAEILAYVYQLSGKTPAARNRA